MKLYEYDQNMVYVQTHEVGGGKTYPPRVTTTPPPETEGFHQWNGREWITHDEYPTPPPPPIIDEPEPEIPEETPEPVSRKMTVGEFFDRFGEHKWEILSHESRLVQAMVKDCSIRTFIDLDDPQLRPGLMMLVAQGIDIDIDEILDTKNAPTPPEVVVEPESIEDEVNEEPEPEED